MIKNEDELEISTNFFEKDKKTAKNVMKSEKKNNRTQTKQPDPKATNNKVSCDVTHRFCVCWIATDSVKHINTGNKHCSLTILEINDLNQESSRENTIKKHFKLKNTFQNQNTFQIKISIFLPLYHERIYQTQNKSHSPFPTSDKTRKESTRSISLDHQRGNGLR